MVYTLAQRGSLAEGPWIREDDRERTGLGIFAFSKDGIHSRYLFPKNESHASLSLRRVIDQSYP